METQEKASQLRLEIASIVLDFSSASKRKFPIQDIYQPFITHKPADAFFSVHYYKHLLYLARKKRIFKAGPLWSIFRDKKRHFIRFRFPSPLGNSFRDYKIAVFTPDFSRGHIYISSQLKETYLYDPLNNYLDELLMINLLSQKRGLLVHACGIEYKGKGFLFVGRSGAGKTTLARLFSNQKDITLLNDERVIIREIKGRFFIFGTPWYGELKTFSKKGVQLKNIFFIKHGFRNRLFLEDPTASLTKLLVYSFLPFWDRAQMFEVLRFSGKIVQRKPCYQLEFLADRSVVDFLKQKQYR